MQEPKTTNIRYATLSRGTAVLCDHKPVQGNYESLCQSVLEYVTSELSKTKYSYETGEHLVHVYTSEQLYYLCVTALAFDRNVAFNFLLELERQLITAGLKERARVSLPYSLRSSFSEIMGSTLLRYSSSDALGRLEGQVDEVTDVIKDNIRKVADRGDQMNDLQYRSEALAFSAADFKKNATKLSRKLWWKNVKLWVVLVVIVGSIAVMITVAVLASQGVFDRKK